MSSSRRYHRKAPYHPIFFCVQEEHVTSPSDSYPATSSLPLQRDWTRLMDGKTERDGWPDLTCIFRPV